MAENINPPTPEILRKALEALGSAIRILGLSLIAYMDATNTYARLKVESQSGEVTERNVNLGGVDGKLFDQGPRA